MLPFQSLTRDSNHSNCIVWGGCGHALAFQSLTRDSNHSNSGCCRKSSSGNSFQSLTRDSNHSNEHNPRQITKRAARFNPSRGIAIIQTRPSHQSQGPPAVSIPHAG